MHLQPICLEHDTLRNLLANSGLARTCFEFSRSQSDWFLGVNSLIHLSSGNTRCKPLLHVSHRFGRRKLTIDCWGQILIRSVYGYKSQRSIILCKYSNKRTGHMCRWMLQQSDWHFFWRGQLRGNRFKNTNSIWLCCRRHKSCRLAADRAYEP
jgi:hypothetical protein